MPLKSVTPSTTTVTAVLTTMIPIRYHLYYNVVQRFGPRWIWRQSQHHTSMYPAPSSVTNNMDCDDANTAINPVHKTSDEQDNNCNGLIDDNALNGTDRTCDVDAERFGDIKETVVACESPNNFVDNSLDCNDQAPQVNPNALETCNNLDDDCDGGIDEDAIDRITLYTDNDGDGFGNNSVLACPNTPGLSDNNDDCNDNNAVINPAINEIQTTSITIAMA